MSRDHAGARTHASCMQSVMHTTPLVVSLFFLSFSFLIPFFPLVDPAARPTLRPAFNVLVALISSGCEYFPPFVPAERTLYFYCTTLSRVHRPLSGANITQGPCRNTPSFCRRRSQFRVIFYLFASIRFGKKGKR